MERKQILIEIMDGFTLNACDGSVRIMAEFTEREARELLYSILEEFPSLDDDKRPFSYRDFD